MQLRRLAALMLLMVPVFQASYGQTTTGTIIGVVKDPNEAVIPNANVVVRNAGTNAEEKGTTNEFGQYKFANLVSGDYIVEVEAQGFRKAVLSPQTLSVGDVIREDVALEIGSVTETVTVETAASKVNTEDAQLGYALRNISGLPVLSGAAGRNPLALVGIQPGITLTTGQTFTSSIGQFAVNGQRSQANNFMLDGIDSNDLAINVPDSVNNISPNALSEFRIVTGAMKSEFGRNSGAVVLETVRSGANEWHGGASEIFRNTRLNAVPFFQKSSSGGTPQLFSNGLPRKPQWNSNDFDANFGGRIKKDKTFFFVSYLGFRRRQGVTNSATVPTEGDRALINQFGTATAKAILGQVPAASSGNILFSAPSNFLDRDQGVAKIDHYFSQSNHFAATYYVEDSLQRDPFPTTGATPVPGFGTSGLTRRNNIILSDTWTFTPNLLNEFRAGFHRLAGQGLIPQNTTPLSTFGLTGVNPDDPAAAGPPWIIISGFSSFGNTIQGPQSRYDNTWHYVDNVSWTHHRHYLKFGGEIRDYAQNQLFDFINNGYFVFDGTGTTTGLVPQIPGLSAPLNDFAHNFATDVIQSNSNRQGYRARSYDWFVQDDWKLVSNLTLNFGLRWEYNSPVTEVHNQVWAFRQGQQSTVFPDAPPGIVYPGDKGVSRSTYHSDWNDFAPRLGFAWDVFGNGKLAVRGGAGIFYDAPITELTLQFLGALPYGIQTDESNVTDIRNPYSTSLINPVPNPYPFHPASPGQHFNYANVAPIGMTVMDPNFRTPYGAQYSLQVQYQVAKNWNLDVGYVGTTGIALLSRRQLNPSIPGPGATTGNTNLRSVLNQGNPLDAAYGGAVFGGITGQLNEGHSSYNGLQTSLTKQFSSGLRIVSSFAWSHAIDNTSGLRTRSRIDGLRNDRGNSEIDARLRYTGAYSYEFPFLKGSHGALKQVVAGWGVSGVTTFQTGFPFDIFDGQDRCLCNSGGNTNRPDYLSGTTLVVMDPRNLSVSGRPNSYFDGTGGGTGGATTNPYFRRVGTSATFAAGAGRYGDLGRNVFHGPGINNWDISVFKNFRFREHHSFQFRTEFFNAFNHTQFNNPVSDINSTSFGRVTTARDPRIIQMALQYQF